MTFFGFTRPTATHEQAPMIQPNQYGIGTTMILPDRPEPTEAERAAARKADQIDAAGVLRAFGWTDDAFLFAMSIGFPKAIKVTMTTTGRRTAIYSRGQIATWRARVVDFASAMQQAKV